MNQTYPMHHNGSEAAFVGCFTFFIILIALAVSILMVVAFCKIFSKAGYHWALGLLVLVPLGNIIMPLFLAFSEWPIHRQTYRYPQNPSSPSAGNAPPRESFRNL